MSPRPPTEGGGAGKGPRDNRPPTEQGDKGGRPPKNPIDPAKRRHLFTLISSAWRAPYPRVTSPGPPTSARTSVLSAGRGPNPHLPVSRGCG
jgi:hypothetical protein